jgi:hypothetical protein
MVGGCGGFRTGGDAEHFSIRLETPKVAEDRLKTTFVAKVVESKCPKKAILFGCFLRSLILISSPVARPQLLRGAQLRRNLEERLNGPLVATP